MAEYQVLKLIFFILTPDRVTSTIEDVSMLTSQHTIYCYKPHQCHNLLIWSTSIQTLIFLPCLNLSRSFNMDFCTSHW